MQHSFSKTTSTTINRNHSLSSRIRHFFFTELQFALIFKGIRDLETKNKDPDLRKMIKEEKQQAKLFLKELLDMLA